MIRETVESLGQLQQRVCSVFNKFLPLDEAIASRAAFVIVSGSDERTDGRAETLFGAS